MAKLGWMLFQLTVAGLVFFYCVDSLNGQGLAPAIFAMVAAFGATALLSAIIDLPGRFRTRGIRESGKPEREIGHLPRTSWRPSNRPQKVDAAGVREDIRKLI